MSKLSSKRQQTQRNNMFSPLPYAYHEAGHAVVGHVIGRLIALVSIKHTTSYRGCCRFDAYAESTHHHDQWQKGRHNPELLTILYAGTVAVSILCEQRGWEYEVLLCWLLMISADQIASIPHQLLACSRLIRSLSEAWGMFWSSQTETQ